MAENEIGDYQCPNCLENGISFGELETEFDRPRLPRLMIKFYCRRCRKEFAVEAGVWIYQVSLVWFLSGKYP